MTLTTAFLAAALVVPSMPPPRFLFVPSWNAAKIVRRGQVDPNPRIGCSVNNGTFLMRFR